MNYIKFKKLLCRFFGHKPIDDEVISISDYQSSISHCERCEMRMMGNTGFSKSDPKIWAYIELDGPLPEVSKNNILKYKRDKKIKKILK